MADPVPAARRPKPAPAAVPKPLAPAIANPAPAMPSAPARLPAPAPARAPAPGREPHGDFWRSVYEVARKDMLQHVRTKRLLIIGAFLLASLVFITLVLPVFILEEGDHAPEPGDPANENQAFAFYMVASVFGGSFFIQLLAVVLTADAVCSEWANRTIFLMLSKPVSRAAFVLGKFLGSLASIIPAIVLLFSLQYLVLQGFYAGRPEPEDVARFFGFLGVLCLGAAAVASVSLFFSSLTRSTVQALLLTIVVVFVVFPLVGNIGDFMYFADEGRTKITDAQYDWSHYLSPERVLTTATDILLEGSNGFGLSFIIPQFPAAHAWLSMVSGGAFTVLFTVLSVIVVQRRNFE